MAWHGGRVQLWDWERFDAAVPAGLDLLHYRLQTGGGYATWPDPAILAPLGQTGPGRRAHHRAVRPGADPPLPPRRAGRPGRAAASPGRRPARPAVRQRREDGMISRRDAPQWVKESGRTLSRTAGRLSSGLRMLPDFLLVGTQRGGTTSLFRALAEHPGSRPAQPPQGRALLRRQLRARPGAGTAGTSPCAAARGSPSSPPATTCTTRWRRSASPPTCPASSCSPCCATRSSAPTPRTSTSWRAASRPRRRSSEPSSWSPSGSRARPTGSGTSPAT